MSQYLLKFDLAHGDIKPPNVMIAKTDDEDLEFKIIDSGSITEIFSSEAKVPSFYNKKIPSWLDSVILRSIAIDKEHRYAHYYELSNPHKVKPYFVKSAPLIERSPLLFYRSAFTIMTIVNFDLYIFY